MKTAQVCACAGFFGEEISEKREARSKKQETRIKSIENRGRNGESYRDL